MLEPYLRRAHQFWRVLSQKIPPLGISVLLHLLLLLTILLAGASFFQERPAKQQFSNVIRAHAVTNSRLFETNNIAELKKIEEKKVAAKRATEQKAKDKERKRQEKLKKEKAKKLKKQKLKQKREKEKKAAAKRAKDKKKKKELDRKKREKEKKAKQQKARDKKLRQQRLKKKKEQEKKRKERRRKEQLRNEMLLEAELESEQLTNSRQQSGASPQKLAQLRATIRQQIERVWNRPKSAPEGRSCRVKVILVPGGKVGKVTVVASSGNEAFDISVVQAVNQAAPFPVPESAALRRELSELEMTFVK